MLKNKKILIIKMEVNMDFINNLKTDMGTNSNNNISGGNGSNYKTIVIDRIPRTIEEFKTMAADCKDPFKTVAHTVVALCMYPVNKDLSILMLNYLKGPKPLSTYEIQFLRDRFMGKEYLAASYFNGAVPENNYQPGQPMSINVYETPYSASQLNEGYLQLFVKSGGADSPRGVKLRQKPSTQQWFLWEYFLLPDIRKPVKNDDWA